MTAIKMYEKIEKHYNDHIYEIKIAENVPGGAAYTIDGIAAYFMPDQEILTASPGKRPVLNPLFKSIYDRDYLLAKAIPGTMNGTRVLQLKCYPDSEPVYIQKKYAAFFGKNAMYYIDSKAGRTSPVLCGSFDGIFHTYAIIMPYIKQAYNTFIPDGDTI